MEYTLPLLHAGIFLFLSALHFYWLSGGLWALAAAVPTDGNERKLFQPGPMATLIVALGLSGFAILNLAYRGVLALQVSEQFIRYAMLVIAIIFLLRAIGDFNYIGLFKRHRQSRFAKWDTVFYSPMCLALGISHIALYFIERQVFLVRGLCI